jgi:choline dehydrogenase-like flavoprotein
VILTAGAVGSPHLLQLSGVGDPDVLTKAGISVRRALPGIGKNFQDHYIARMSCEVEGDPYRRWFNQPFWFRWSRQEAPAFPN